MVWPPVLTTIEDPPGYFKLLDGQGKCVAEIVFVRRGEECGYRAVIVPQGADETAILVGYFTSLLPAVKAAHLRLERATKAATEVSISTNYAGRSRLADLVSHGIHLLSSCPQNHTHN